MARTLRMEYPGAIYHVTCRLVGAWRDGDRELFRDAADRWRFLDSLATRVEAFGVVRHRYVLMQNHTHAWAGTGSTAPLSAVLENEVGEVDEDLKGAMSVSRLGIGDEAFRDETQSLYAELVAATSRPEDAALRNVVEALTADQVLAELARLLGCERALFAKRSKGTAHRPFASLYLTPYAGLSQREVAAILGVSTGAAVSLQLRRFDALVADSRKLRSLVKTCDKALLALMRTASKAKN